MYKGWFFWKAAGFLDNCCNLNTAYMHLGIKFYLLQVYIGMESSFSILGAQGVGGDKQNIQDLI